MVAFVAVICIGSAVLRDGVREWRRPHVSNTAGGKVQGTGCCV